MAPESKIQECEGMEGKQERTTILLELWSDDYEQTSWEVVVMCEAETWFGLRNAWLCKFAYWSNVTNVLYYSWDKLETDCWGTSPLDAVFASLLFAYALSS